MSCTCCPPTPRSAGHLDMSGTCRHSSSHFLVRPFSLLSLSLFDPVGWRFSNPAKKHWQMALGKIRSSLAHLQTPHTHTHTNTQAHIRWWNTHLQTCIPVPTPSFPLSWPNSPFPESPSYILVLHLFHFPVVLISCYQVFMVLEQNMCAINKMHFHSLPILLKPLSNSLFICRKWEHIPYFLLSSLYD